MKKAFLLCCLVALLVSCGGQTVTWEYKVVKVAGQDASIASEFGPKVFDDQTSMLNKMGKDGWELVNAFTEIGTAFPNFGNSEYVTGIRENTRTMVLNFIFKRPAQKEEAKPKPISKK